MMRNSHRSSFSSRPLIAFSASIVGSPRNRFAARSPVPSAWSPVIILPQCQFLSAARQHCFWPRRIHHPLQTKKRQVARHMVMIELALPGCGFSLGERQDRRPFAAIRSAVAKIFFGSIGNSLPWSSPSLNSVQPRVQPRLFCK